jgi:hypothetical protein
MKTTVAPLSDFCRDRPCTYDQFRDLVATWKPCPHGEAGTCGDFRYVEIDAADGMERAYFVRSGFAIAAVTSSDMGYAGTYGTVPACERKMTETLCGR